MFLLCTYLAHNAIYFSEIIGTCFQCLCRRIMYKQLILTVNSDITSWIIGEGGAWSYIRVLIVLTVSDHESYEHPSPPPPPITDSGYDTAVKQRLQYLEKERKSHSPSFGQTNLPSIFVKLAFVKILAKCVEFN